MSRRRRSVAYAELEAGLGHSFADKTHLDRALTHISAAKSSEGRLGSYQRLEFLGDRVLGLGVAAMLVEAFPNAREGELSQRLADLVRAETCAEVAAEMDLAPYIRLGSGEASSGGRKKAAILADVCEAVVGAVYLDGGFAAGDALVRRFWEPRMLASRRPTLDPKTELQEWAQGQGLPTPIYREVARTGPDHDLSFEIAVTIDGVEEGQGAGRSKREAERSAARDLLDRKGVSRGHSA